MIKEDSPTNAFELVRLHSEASTLSFENKFKIMQVMRKFLGNLRLNHISLDLCTPDNEMLFLSSNPTTGYNICSTPLWKFDGSISPTHFKNKSFYWWDETYLPEAKDAIMLRKENAHGISRGFMLSKKVEGFRFVYSFGLEENHNDNERFVQEHRDAYMQIGDLAYLGLKNLYQKYCPTQAAPMLTAQSFISAVIYNE